MVGECSGPRFEGAVRRDQSLSSARPSTDISGGWTGSQLARAAWQVCARRTVDR
jgi:hypothetical protein